MRHYAPEAPKNIVPFAPSPKDQAHESDLDRSGHAIVALLQEAAEVARGNAERAMDMANKLSGQLRAAEDRASAAEDRAKLLETDLRLYQDRALRAEEWLLRVYKEIEDKFFNQNAPHRSAQKWG
jgi:hypothetical protein